MLPSVEHRQRHYRNNRAENAHQLMRERERQHQQEHAQLDHPVWMHTPPATPLKTVSAQLNPCWDQQHRLFS